MWNAIDLDSYATFLRVDSAENTWFSLADGVPGQLKFLLLLNQEHEDYKAYVFPKNAEVRQNIMFVSFFLSFLGDEHTQRWQHYSS